MPVTINGMLYQDLELKGYGYRKALPFDVDLAAFHNAINTSGAFDATAPTGNGQDSPVFAGGYVYPLQPNPTVVGVVLDGRWYAVDHFKQFGYKFFKSIFSSIELSIKSIYLVWLSTDERLIYIWDSVQERWYDLINMTYLIENIENFNSFLWENGSIILWNSGSTMIQEGA